MWALVDRVKVCVYEISCGGGLGVGVRWVRGIVHPEGPMVMEIVLVGEGGWKVGGLPVRVMVRVELGTGALSVCSFSR